MAGASFRDLYNRAVMPEMTPAERERAEVLIIETDPTIRTHLRQTLMAIGYLNVFDAPNHMAGLKKIEERHVSHLIFDAKKTNMPPADFLQKVFEMDNGVVTIAASFEPTVDDVFSLLIIGARGYIVKPFNSQSLDETIAMATKGEPISDSILHAKDRNEALACLMLSSLDRLSTIMRQAQQFETAQRDVPKRALAFRRAVDIARTFANGGPEKLLEALLDAALERSAGPASRLGKIRKRLETKKGSISKKGPEAPLETPSS